MFAWSHEFCEALELVSKDGPVTLTLQSQVLLEVGVEVLLEGEVSHEAHSADAAVKLDSLENLCLGSFIEPDKFKQK